MRIGAAYYPEPGDRAARTRDIALMQAAGLNSVRMGDLIWDQLEPEDGVFTLEWLQETVAELGQAGIATFLATPTASIPLWLHRQHPDVMHLTAAGVRKPFGKRRHACLRHPEYRHRSLRIAERMAAAFRDSPDIIAVQTDNELMAEEPHCYCAYCQQAFATWLEQRYGTVDRLNTAWGLGFWSQRVRSFSDIFLPQKGDNPSAYVNFLAWASEVAVEFHAAQRAVFKQALPQVPVTHNICSSGFLYLLDHYRLGQACDVMAIDNYPYGWTLENEYGNRGAFTFSPHMTSLALAQVRGGRPGQPFLVAEAQIGRTCGNQRKIVEPRMVRLWSVQEVAQGACGIWFFPFLPFAAGHEHVMAAVLDGDRIPRRRSAEVCQIAAETASLRQVTGNALPVARACILRDFRCDWAFEDGRFCADFRPMRHLHQWYRAVRRLGIGCDVVAPHQELSGYDLILVPALVLVDDTVCAALEAAAARGATIVLTCLTGLRDPDVRSFGPLVHPRLADLAGIAFMEQHPLFAAEDTALRWNLDDTAQRCGLWHDVVTPVAAEVLAVYASRFFAGTPVITRRQGLPGTVYHVGSILSDEAIAAVIDQACGNAAVRAPAVSSHDQMELTEVVGAAGRFVYALNFSETEQPIQFLVPAADASSGEPVGSEMRIPARDFRLFRLVN
jgi:beta-galactosidase